MAGQSSKQIDRRMGYIDALKGFAIICVVLGHVAVAYLGAGAYPESIKLLNNICNLIYAFHMPLLMMLSGYLYYTAYFNDIGMPDRKRLYRQVYNLIAVYFIFSLALGLIKIVVGSLIDGFLIGKMILLDIALMWITPFNGFWYLYVLILLYLIFSINRLTEVNKWILLGIFTATAICGQVVNIPWFMISSTLYYAIFFFIGIAGKKYKDWIIGNKYLTLVLFTIAVGAGVLVWSKKRDTSVYANRIFLLSIVVALGISLALWYILEHINFFEKSKILKLCGRCSLEIYLIQEYFLAGVRTVVLKIGVQNVYISIILNFFISMAGPIMFSMLCKKLNIYELLFKPVTYVTNKFGKDGGVQDR